MAKKTDYLFSNVWTIPNLISFARILIIPLFAYLFYKGELVWAVATLALSGLSDMVDGKIARRFNQVSELGKMLDPIADKLTVATIAVMLFWTFYNAENETLKMFSWAFLLFIGKELFMLLVGAIMIAIGIHPGAAEIFGKIATLVFYCVMVVIMGFGPEVGAFREWFTLPDTVMIVLVVISIVATFIALFSYFPGAISQFRERFSAEGRAKALAEKNAK